jgi:hypothetical protein
MGWTVGVQFVAFGTVFLFSTVSRPNLVPSSPLSNGYRGALSPEVKWPECDLDCSSPVSAEVKNSGAIPPLLYTSYSVVLN